MKQDEKGLYESLHLHANFLSKSQILPFIITIKLNFITILMMQFTFSGIYIMEMNKKTNYHTKNK